MEEKEYSSVTNELLERTERCKNSIASNFVPHDKEIIAGIKKFEIVLKEINPEYIDDNIKKIIEGRIAPLIYNENSEFKYVNYHILHGINLSLGILDGYIQGVKKRTKSIEK